MVPAAIVDTFIADLLPLRERSRRTRNRKKCGGGERVGKKPTTVNAG